MPRRLRELPEGSLPARRAPASSPADVAPFLDFCRRGQLYEAEEWIDSGRPIQWTPPDCLRLRRIATPMQVALNRRFFSLAELLLVNGYDPDGDLDGNLTSAVISKDRALVELLVRFGADPKLVPFDCVLETCDRSLMDRFLALGIDPCEEDAVAHALRTKARPVLGFVKSHLASHPLLQIQVDLALQRFVQEADARGVALMLWLGADPHALVERDGSSNETAFESALHAPEPILAVLLKKPIPTDRVPELLRRAAYRASVTVIDRLLSLKPDLSQAEEGVTVLQAAISPFGWRLGEDRPSEDERRLTVIGRLLAAGAPLGLTAGRMSPFRRDLLNAKPSLVRRLIPMLIAAGAMTDQQARELNRSSALKRHLQSMGDASGAWPPNGLMAAAPSNAKGSYWRRHWAARD